MKHIVFYSGGIGSWMTAKRVIGKYGKENTVLLFTDTLIEDDDLYRFIDETILDLGAEYVRIEDGRTPWEVFKDVRWLGNSRLAQCSHLLKQKTAEEWLRDNYKPEECILYLGIDWTEEHRKSAPEKNWHPYKIEFPMCEEPYLSKEDMLNELEKLGIETPRLYKLGFSHNNCGGMCVRGGQGHFIHLLKNFPERFKFMEDYEKEMQEYLGQGVTILSESKKGVSIVWKKARKRYEFVNYVKLPLSLEELRRRYEKQDIQLDLFDIGGCGCFVNVD